MRLLFYKIKRLNTFFNIILELLVNYGNIWRRFNKYNNTSSNRRIPCDISRQFFHKTLDLINFFTRVFTAKNACYCISIAPKWIYRIGCLKSSILRNINSYMDYLWRLQHKNFKNKFSEIRSVKNPYLRYMYEKKISTLVAKILWKLREK